MMHIKPQYIQVWVFIVFCFLSQKIKAQAPPVYRDSVLFFSKKKTIQKADLKNLNTLSWKLIESDTGLAKKAALLALHHARELNSKTNEALAYNRLGKLADQSGDFDRAVHFYNANLKIRKATYDTIGQSNTHLNLGNTYKKTADYQKAMDHYFRAIGLLELYGKNDFSLEANIYNNMGAVYARRGENAESMKCYQKALQLNKAIGDKSGYASGCLNIGAQLVKNGSIKEGLDFLHRAYQIQQELADIDGMAKTLTNMGNVKFEANRFKEAIEHYSMAMEKQETLGNKAEITKLLNNMGSAYVMMDSNKQAYSFYTKGLALAKKIKARRQHAQFFENLAYLEESAGNYQAAFNWLYSYDSLSALLLNEVSNKQINELRVKYDLLKQENQMKQLESNKQKQEYTITQQQAQIRMTILVLILVTIIGAVLSIAYKQKQRANKLLTSQKELITKKEKEKELLLKELNHRVKNNLQIISSMLSLQSFELTDPSASAAIKAGQGRIEALSLIHQKLYQTEMVTHVDMPEYINKLSAYISGSFGERKIKVECDVNVQSMEADIAIPIGLILNELMSNSFKHAFPGVENPKINIALNETPGMYELQLSDNGIGFDSDKQSQKQSFGLHLIHSLVKQIKGDLSVITAQGFTASLQVPKAIL